MKLITVPEGFRVTLFAAEPDVAQPVSMAIDDRGRLWVAECFSYPGTAGPWKSLNRDRILIFDDTTGKGEFDRHTVFTDNHSPSNGLVKCQYVSSEPFERPPLFQIAFSSNST